MRLCAHESNLRQEDFSIASVWTLSPVGENDQLGQWGRSSGVLASLNLVRVDKGSRGL